MTKQTQKQRDCLHVVIRTQNPGWRYVCVKCGKLQKILNGILVFHETAQELTGDDMQRRLGLR